MVSHDGTKRLDRQTEMTAVRVSSAATASTLEALGDEE